MSPRLKPLLLPQLVEERRKMEMQQATDPDHAYIYSTYNSSSSDLASPSPVTPTFSRTAHSRHSGSASSLEMISSPCTESPASPTQPVHVNKNTTKLPLPDVQEDPLEREDEDPTLIPTYGDREFDLYDCLCDEPCSHHGEFASITAPHHYMASDFDYDLGFLSDGDVSGSPRQKKRRHGSDVGFSTWSTRLGSKITGRWRSTSRRQNFTFTPASDPALDQRPGFPRAASSRSSSISAPTRVVPERPEPPLPATPALSFYESTESVAMSTLEVRPAAAVGKSLERDRSMATTPLLPPLLTEMAAFAPPPRSAQVSPLQSPTVAPCTMSDMPLAQNYPTPPLSAKASVSSFRRGTISSTFSDVTSPIPCLLDHQDSWSDRLGHANFTIEPKPYSPETVDSSTFQAFHADWNLARINYTKHLVRTGEHYGTTSKTYALTEAKWAEVEKEWQQAEDNLVQRLDPQVAQSALLTIQLRRATEDMLPAAIPHMLSNEKKFPALGDLDIVGPMVRDAVMAREGQDEKKHGASLWLRNLAGKVGLRR